MANHNNSLHPLPQPPELVDMEAFHITPPQNKILQQHISPFIQCSQTLRTPLQISDNTYNITLHGNSSTQFIWCEMLRHAWGHTSSNIPAQPYYPEKLQAILFKHYSFALRDVQGYLAIASAQNYKQTERLKEHISQCPEVNHIRWIDAILNNQETLQDSEKVIQWIQLMNFELLKGENLYAIAEHTALASGLNMLSAETFLDWIPIINDAWEHGEELFRWFKAVENFSEQWFKKLQTLKENDMYKVLNNIVSIQKDANTVNVSEEDKSKPIPDIIEQASLEYTEDLQLMETPPYTFAVHLLQSKTGAIPKIVGIWYEINNTLPKHLKNPILNP